LKVDIPRIVVAATHSGAGKTSLTLALTAALRGRGFAVQTFKVGPDFLDPTYLALASGRPCYNLDGWMMGEAYITDLFARVSAGADIAVIEGVMGLFDGADAATSAGSTAEIARWLAAPVLLVVDAQGAARSVAALVKGFDTFEAGLEIAGVVANRCASEQHARWLGDALASASLPPLVGAIGRGAFPPLAGRHLGLVSADGHLLSPAVLASFANALEKGLSLETVNELARAAAPLTSFAAARERRKRKISLGLPFDEAFHFYYRDTLDELEAQGCELVRFSPLRDDRLPEGLAGLYIGGGYPEVHARELAANGGMLQSLRDFARLGSPIYGECGGLMYLSESLEAADGTVYPMAGIMPLRTRMRKTRKYLGYVEATLNEDSLWGRKGDLFRGHEFHYSELVSEEKEESSWRPAYSLKRNRPGTIIPEGFQCGNVLASYAHLHFGSRPAAVGRFVAKCGGAV